jgi:polysaccharide export outer membrane protein
MASMGETMKNVFYKIVLFVCAVMAWNACVTAQGVPVPSATAMPSSASVPVAGGSDATVSGHTSDDYILGVADKVRVTVYNEPNLTGEYSVNSNGKISMPLIGDVQAAGLAVGGLRENIEHQLGNGYLINPQAAIDVLTFRPFYILGEVSKPGQYPATAGLTVVNAVATAEGFTYRANKRYVYIKHAGSSEERKVELSPDLMIQPGDTIRVAERFF